MAIPALDAFDHQTIVDLVARGETTHVDFKITCDAFDTSKLGAGRAKAELVKDICAMANNRDEASYLIIGVSDDGKDFKSVLNPKLTDENIQTVCKDSISPPPRVLSRFVEIPNTSECSIPARILVIQIGPHSHEVYRLAKDFISAHGVEKKEAFHFRRNDVWIRRGTTCDTASPEEIAGLKANANSPFGPPADDFAVTCKTTLITPRQKPVFWFLQPIPPNAEKALLSIQAILFLQITNLKEIPRTVDSYGIEQKDELGHWRIVSLVDARHGTLFFAGSNSEFKKATRFDLTDDAFDYAVSNQRLEPHNTVGGWVLIRSGNPQALDDCRFALRDTTGKEFAVKIMRPNIQGGQQIRNAGLRPIGYEDISQIRRIS